MKQQLTRVMLGLVVVSSLAGCAPSGEEELTAWMNELRSSIKPKITPLDEPKQFTPAEYVADVDVDPFNSVRLTRALRRDTNNTAQNSGLIAEELARRKEPLEAFPLDAMTMVGSLDRGGKRVALLRVDKLLYQVRVGEHLGQNYGRVTKITEGDVVLREIVQDAAGEWIERNSELQLQEKKR